MEINLKEHPFSSDAAEIILLFQKFQFENNLESADKFITKLLSKIDPYREPKYESQNGSLDLLRNGGMLYFANGTLGDRIFFKNYDPNKDSDTPVDAPIRYMVYPFSDALLGYQKKIANNWRSTFGCDVVDLNQKIE